MNKWIRVEDRLPENEQIILVHENCGKAQMKIISAIYINNHFECDHSCTLENVTHWMELPEPPKENDEFYTTNNPKSFKDQLFNLLKKSPNNLPNKSFFGKEKIVDIRYLLECFVKTDLENEKIIAINVSQEKIFWHPNGIKIDELEENDE